MPDSRPTDPASSEPDEQSELEQATAWLEKLTRDPLADAVPGKVRVVSASDPAERGRYQECVLELRVEAAGVPGVTAAHRAVFPRRVWPRPGDVLPARVSPSDPTAFEIDWTPLTRRPRA